jgi:hypothetical protein
VTKHVPWPVVGIGGTGEVLRGIPRLAGPVVEALTSQEVSDPIPLTPNREATTNENDAMEGNTAQEQVLECYPELQELVVTSWTIDRPGGDVMERIGSDASPRSRRGAWNFRPGNARQRLPRAVSEIMGHYDKAAHQQSYPSHPQVYL